MRNSRKANKFQGKVVWITGASSGIGEQLCYQFAKQGASLIISATSAAKLELVKANLVAYQVAVHILPFDLEQLKELPDKVTDALGFFGKVDILVNNAGIALKDWVLSTKLEIDQKVMNINYFGPIVLTKHLLPHMLDRGDGQVVVISSLSGKYGVPKISSYAASKHALQGFFETLRSEIADSGVDITIIIPGIIQTEITAHALKGDGSIFGKVDKTFQKAYPPEKAAEKILQAVLKRKEETFVGGSEGITLMLNRLSPWLFRRLIRSHPIKKMRKLKRLLSFKKKRHSMNFFDKMRLVLHIIRWRLTWRRYSLGFLPPKADSEKFISARKAAALINDNACVFSSGIAGNALCEIFFYAIRERFKRSGHPKSLTWINSGAQGSRGRVPGTIEELGLPGLMKSYIAGHIETAKAQLRLAQRGELELYTLPQGVISLLLEEQGKGNTTLTSEVGLGTFLDPAVGTGAAINANAKEKYILREGESLKYTMPQPEIALLSAPYADKEGNIYFKHASTITENIQSINAVRKNSGIVMVAVAGIILKNEKEISVPVQQVDYIVVNPYNKQTVSVPQSRYWPMFTPDYELDRKVAVKQLKFINTFLKITPVRNTVDDDMARLAASLFLKTVPKDGLVNIGVGFPEEVVRILVENDLEEEFIFTTEAGSFGGMPAPGIFFGAAIAPDHLEPSSKMFTRYYDHLDMAVLGFLEVDTRGNVNVSKKGPEVTDYVGPGGFPDIVHSAKNIIFIGHWMQKAKFGHEGEKVKLLQAGTPKFVDQVSEITFNGQEALRRGKNVYYVTNVGYFKLTKHGLQLMAHFPGIDIKKDILANCNAHIFFPKRESIPVIDPAMKLVFDHLATP